MGEANISKSNKHIVALGPRSKNIRSLLASFSKNLTSSEKSLLFDLRI